METQLPTRAVIDNATNNLPDYVAVKMPSLQNLKQTVRRVRQQNDPLGIPQPNSLADLEIPDNLALLDDGENFVLYDSGPETGNRR